jgi:hypothetical protein
MRNEANQMSTNFITNITMGEISEIYTRNQMEIKRTYYKLEKLKVLKQGPNGNKLTSR